MPVCLGPSSRLNVFGCMEPRLVGMTAMRRRGPTTFERATPCLDLRSSCQPSSVSNLMSWLPVSAGSSSATPKRYAARASGTLWGCTKASSSNGIWNWMTVGAKSAL